MTTVVASGRSLLGGAGPSVVVHWPQNLKPGGFSKWQRGQISANAVVHCPQNFIPSGLSKPHLEQRIFSLAMRLSAQFVEQGLRVFEVGGIEALGEPTVDLDEHRARLVANFGVAEQPRQAHRRAQFK